MDIKLNPKVRKAAGVAMAIGAGIFAVLNSLADQQKEEEHEAMKRDIAELKANKGDS